MSNNRINNYISGRNHQKSKKRDRFSEKKQEQLQSQTSTYLNYKSVHKNKNPSIVKTETSNVNQEDVSISANSWLDFLINNPKNLVTFILLTYCIKIAASQQNTPEEFTSITLPDRGEGYHTRLDASLICFKGASIANGHNKAAFFVNHPHAGKKDQDYFMKIYADYTKFFDCDFKETRKGMDTKGKNVECLKKMTAYSRTFPDGKTIPFAEEVDYDANCYVSNEDRKRPNLGRK